jgi:hypothetical protein
MQLDAAAIEFDSCSLPSSMGLWLPGRDEEHGANGHVRQTEANEENRATAIIRGFGVCCCS